MCFFNLTFRKRIVERKILLQRGILFLSVVLIGLPHGIPIYNYNVKLTSYSSFVNNSQLNVVPFDYRSYLLHLKQHDRTHTPLQSSTTINMCPQVTLTYKKWNCSVPFIRIQQMLLMFYIK